MSCSYPSGTCHRKSVEKSCLVVRRAAEGCDYYCDLWLTYAYAAGVCRAGPWQPVSTRLVDRLFASMAVVDGQIEECGSVVLLCFAVGAEAVSQSDSQ
jgi:hypothetical protein